MTRCYRDVTVMSPLSINCLCGQEEEDFRRKMRLVLNEWVAETVQLHFGKATPENDEKFYAFVQVRPVRLLAIESILIESTAVLSCC